MRLCLAKNDKERLTAAGRRAYAHNCVESFNAGCESPILQADNRHQRRFFYVRSMANSICGRAVREAERLAGSCRPASHTRMTRSPLRGTGGNNSPDTRRIAMQELPAGITIAITDIQAVEQELRSLTSILNASSEIRCVECGILLTPINSKLSDAVRRINEERQEK